MLENKLKNAGLPEGEIKVYLASLKSGSETVMHLAEKAGIKRPTCYVMIESLMQKGLMSSFAKGKKRYFSAESPERLLDLVGEQKIELDARKKDIDDILPELTSIFNISGTRPRTRFFEGKEGVRTIQKDILKSKPRYVYNFAPLDPAHELYPPSPGDLREKVLKRKGTKTKIIYTSKKGERLPKKQGGTVTKFVSPEKFPFSSEIVIYNDKVAFLSFKEEILGVIIESKQIAETMRTMFNLAWGNSR